MITTNKCVLVAQELDALNTNYEAIVVVTRVEEIYGVWKNNKTPIMLESNVPSYIRHIFTLLIVPEVALPEDFILFCHMHHIECGEYKYGEKYNTADEDCFLCDIAVHKGFESMADFNSYSKNYTDMVIYESENFYVKIELGCLKVGMLMVCPKEHIMSAAQIPDELMEEYEQVKRDTEFILKATFGNEPVIFFEHGSAPSGISSHKRSVVHAHTHVAWGVRFEEQYLEMVSVKPVTDIKTLAETKYFSYQEGANGEFYAVSDPQVYVQRQYPRQIIALMEGIPNEKSNWRVEPFHDNMKETFRAIYDYLVANKEFINSRIVDATECYVKGYARRRVW